MKYYILYNPLAGHGGFADKLTQLKGSLDGECLDFDVTKLDGYSNLLTKLDENDVIILCGGDGTLNKFVNSVDVDKIKNDILYLACGSGNDFVNDVGKENKDKPFKVNKYLVNLPTVTVNGKTYKVVNGVGFGIDGYCCQVGDELKSKSKKVDYTAIAIKGLLFHFKPCNAKIIVDGRKYEYKKVWIAPTMNGRHYGGGMTPTPNQDRLKSDHVSVLSFHGSNAIHTLMMFPKLFTGEHVKFKKHVQIHEGKKVEVIFDKPCALQIDGETILGVTSYTVEANPNKK